MSLKTKVTIQSKTITYDSEGIASESWTDIVSLEGTLLPFGNKLALQEYGFVEQVKYRFFYKGTNSNLVVGNRITTATGLELPIVYVADYRKAQDVLLNETQENSP